MSEWLFEILEEWEVEVKAIEVRKEGGYRQFITNKLEDGIHPQNKAEREWMDKVIYESEGGTAE